MSNLLGIKTVPPVVNLYGKCMSIALWDSSKERALS